MPPRMKIFGNTERILLSVEKNPGLTAWQHAKRLALPTSTVSSILKKKSDTGVIYREWKEDGERGAYVYMKGKKDETTVQSNVQTRNENSGRNSRD